MHPTLLHRIFGDSAQSLVPDEEAAPVWTPLPGPQALAVETDADELLYGGAAGGGKTDLMIGLALTQHLRSVIFRREYGELQAILDRTREIVGPDESYRYNGQSMIWRWPGGHSLQYGAMQHEENKFKWQGQPHDLKEFDEITQFSETQYEFVTTWKRTTRRRQRTRTVCAGNPPVGGDGIWVIDHWAPWLDDQYPYPAQPGEKRWFARLDDKWVEVDNGDAFDWKGETIHPTSRTFIPARLTDNPYLMETNYLAEVQKLPEPMRSAFLNGDFRSARQDALMQVVPGEWLRLAVKRWTPARPRDREGQPWPLAALGCDVARGGDDRTTVFRKYTDPDGLRGPWYASPLIVPGVDTPDGAATAELVLDQLRMGGTEDTLVFIDALGVGTSPYDILHSALGERCIGVNHGRRNKRDRDRSRRYKFRTERSRDWWWLREALDPVYGEQPALPPHPDLLRELIMPQYTLQIGDIYVEGREDLVHRLGRSPDIATALVLANRRGGVIDRTAYAEVDTGPMAGEEHGGEALLTEKERQQWQRMQ